MPLLRRDLEAVLAPFPEARPLPAVAYTDAGIFAFEERTVFHRAWRCVGLASELAQPGSWLRTAIRRRTLVVMRGEDGEIRALYDACPHRAAPVFSGDRGETLRPTCGYHGWVFDSRGSLRECTDLPRGVDATRLGLPKGRAASAYGLVFASGDPNAPDFHATGPVPPWITRAAITEARVAIRARWMVAANWKLVVENFQESHHFPRVHPTLEARTPSAHATSFLTDPPCAWIGGRMPFAEGVETVSFSRKRNGRPLVAAPEDASSVHDALMFPLFLTSLQPDYLLIYRLDPLAPDQTLVEHELIVAPGAPKDGPSDVIDFWGRIHEEDRLICEAQQRSLIGGGWSPVCYAACEDGVHAFDRRIAAILWEVAQ